MARLTAEQYIRALREIRLLATDVDGVLTDGSIAYEEGDRETKVFNVRDGSAVYLARELGLEIAVITGRTSAAVRRRFEELPVLAICQGEIDKRVAGERLATDAGITMEQVAFIGDDLVDLGLMRCAGLGICVADAHPRVLAEADWVTHLPGGRGAFREVVDDIITAREAWEEVLRQYGDG